MIKDIINHLEKTGSYNGEVPEYRLLRLDEEVGKFIGSMESKYIFYDALDEIQEDVVQTLLVTRDRFEENLKGIHVTKVENADSIRKVGLKIPQNNNIPNLGKGIYGIRNMNHTEYQSKEPFGSDGHESLSEWVLDSFGMCEYEGEEYEEKLKSTKICVVEFAYTGRYRECIYGEDHVGYIALNTDIAPEDVRVEIMSLEEYEEKY